MKMMPWVIALFMGFLSICRMGRVPGKGAINLRLTGSQATVTVAFAALRRLVRGSFGCADH
jgi:hypothetical protein